MLNLDNYDLYASHEAAQEKMLNRLPKCECCGQAIQSDWQYLTPDGWVCEDCLKENYRKEVYAW